MQPAPAAPGAFTEQPPPTSLLLLTDLPGDVHGLLFHALAADDPEDCCSFFLSCKSVCEAAAVRAQVPAVARELVRALVVKLPSFDISGADWSDDMDDLDRMGDTELDLQAALAPLVSTRSRRLKKLTFTVDTDVEGTAYTSLVQLLQGCAQQSSYEGLMHLGAPQANLAKVLSLLAGVQVMRIMDEVSPSMSSAGELVPLLAARCPRLHCLTLLHKVEVYGTSSLSGIAALLDALAASPVIKLRSLHLPWLPPSAAVFAAIERLSVGVGSMLRILHVRSVPAASVQHLRAIRYLFVSKLPALSQLPAWSFPQLQRLHVGDKSALMPAASITQLPVLLQHAKLLCVSLLRFYCSASDLSHADLIELGVGLRAVVESGDAPPIAHVGVWELRADGKQAVPVGPLNALADVWQQACAGLLAGCKRIEVIGRKP